MNELKLSDWTNIAQATAAIIGIYFLIVNLFRTNKMIKLQSKALRIATMPILKTDIKVGYLTELTQKKRTFPIINSI